MENARHFFSSIPADDRLSLYAGGRPNGQAVVDFLHLKRRDVARAAKVQESSVRYDLRMPEVLEQWLHVVATSMNLVAEFFGDKEKTALWFSTPNPMLGSIAPIDMIRMGRHRKLLTFVQTALDENKR